jgi:hypothetical protein
MGAYGYIVTQAGRVGKKEDRRLRTGVAGAEGEEDDAGYDEGGAD